MFKFLPFVLLVGCTSFDSMVNSFRSDVPPPLEPEEEMDLYIPTQSKPLLYMHWQCCIDLCKGKQPLSVTKELHTPYIICECKTGKIFRVTRLRKGMK